MQTQLQDVTQLLGKEDILSLTDSGCRMSWQPWYNGLCGSWILF
jgi:hypothetical protein